MSISVVSKPNTTITGDEQNISKWAGTHQPMVFEVQRKDFNVLAIWDETFQGEPQKVFQVLGTQQEFTVGTTFNYVCFNDFQRAYTLTVARVFFNGSRTYVAFNTSGVYESNKITSNQAFVNVTRKGYYIEGLVYLSNLAGQLNLVGTLRAKTNQFGVAKCNVQKVISSQLSFENKFSYDAINDAQIDQGGIYQLRCREVYENVVGKFTSVLNGDTQHYVNGSKQLQEPNNFNFGEFVPTQNASRENKAKFLSVFNRPTYFNGYPFSLSFIWSDNMKNQQLERVEQTVDVNGGLGSEVSTDLIMSKRGFVNRLMLSGSFASSVKSLNVWLNEGLPTLQTPMYGGGDLFEPNTVVDGFLEDIKIRVIDLSAWDAIRRLRDRTIVKFP